MKPSGDEQTAYSLKAATDKSREVCEMRKTCETRHVCTSYFIFFMLLHKTDFLCLEPSRSSSNYAQDKGIFS